MDFSCHTSAFQHLSLTEALGTVARLGFRCVDLGNNAHLNTARAAAEPRKLAVEIRQDLDAFDLRISDFSLPLPRISLADADRRSKEIETFKSLLPFIQALGAPGVSVSPGLAHPPDDAEAYTRARDGLREMLDAGQKAGLHVSVVPHMDSMAQTPDALKRLLKDVPGLSLTLDWSVLVVQDVSHDDIAALLPDARHVTLRQAARAQLQLPYERGRIEPSRVLGALHTANYSGVIGINYLKMTDGTQSHGLIEVNTIRESARLRDELKKARDEISSSPRN